jgi:hypothetical protein
VLLKVAQPLKYLVQGTSLGLTITPLSISLRKKRAQNRALRIQQFINRTFPDRISFLLNDLKFF